MIRDQKDSTFGKKSNVWLLFEFRKGALLTFKRFFVEGVGYLRTVSREKTAVLLDFVQVRGGGTAQFLAPFHKCIFGQQKVYISCKMQII